MNPLQQNFRRVAVIAAATLILLSVSHRALADGVTNNFVQTNLVSDTPGVANNTDPNLVNPWGVALSSSSPFWVSDNATGLATLYNSDGVRQALIVTIPGLGGQPGEPTGVIFNGTTNFNSDLFIFAGENGTIAGWRGALGTTAETLFTSSDGAVYKGIATATIPQGTYLYAADFHNNQINVLPGSGAPALTGQFQDPNLPAGYAPFNIANIGGNLYVTYALQDGAKMDDVAGAGHGIVDVYDLNGNFVQRLITGGSLDSPWGLALAPTGFGSFASDLLVGNFGDGTINAFNPGTGAFLGQLDDASGNPIVNPGLWALTFGNGGNGGIASDLYFTAGSAAENHGLLGSLAPTSPNTATPEPETLTLLTVGVLALLACQVKRSGHARLGAACALYDAKP
jgi:uncharacterized protein (TIGR03118 family)